MDKKQWEIEYGNFGIKFMILIAILISFYPLFPLQGSIVITIIPILCLPFGYRGHKIILKYKSEMETKDYRGYRNMNFGLIIMGSIVLTTVTVGMLIELYDWVGEKLNPPEPDPSITTLDPFFPWDYYNEQVWNFTRFMIGIYGLMLSFLFFYLARKIFLKNRISSTTKLFSVSFVFFGLSLVTSLIFGWVQDMSLTLMIFIYLISYTFLYSGTVALTHSAKILVDPTNKIFSKNVYLGFLSTYIIGVILILKELSLNLLQPPQQETTFFDQINSQVYIHHLAGFNSVIALLIGLSIIIPASYAILKLGQTPEWITEERKSWIKKLRTGLVLFFIHPLFNALGEMNDFDFINQPLNKGTDMPTSLYLQYMSIVILIPAIAYLLTAIPDIDKWFFDEIKFRATGDGTFGNQYQISNIFKLWDVVEEWKETKVVKKSEMTQAKLDEYVITAKQMLIQFKHT